ncbi:MAG: Mut7-C RNAse domain-containing protein [Acidobacteriota bacterium]
MLGSLARWLRILDYDTEYVRFSDDDELIAWSNAEGRVLLTKDRRLAARRAVHRVLLIRGATLGAQIREVLAFTGDDPRRRLLFRRCLECNRILREIPPAEAAPEVPPYVFRTQRRFLRCPACRKIYWAGTHRSHMLERLRRLLDEPEPGRG